MSAIKAIDGTSVHRITSGQVVIDLQTAVKELLENSLDASATNIEIRFKHYGLRGIEVIDNGCGISEDDYEGIGLKHHTSKLSSFSDLTTVRSFGFRGEALSSLCALSESVTVTTSTSPPMGDVLELAPSGRIKKRFKAARQRGTTVSLTNLFSNLPVRRKELEKNIKREFGKALSLLNAYALVPCSGMTESGTAVRLTVVNHLDKGQKPVQLRTPGSLSLRASISSLWGPKTLDNLVDLNLSFPVQRDKNTLRRLSNYGHLIEQEQIDVVVRGLISKFSYGCGRSSTDRQFFYVNGRPCNLGKLQKALNEVYRSFNTNQTPFVIADFILPTDTLDVNVSPDKRTIFLHAEGNLITAFKTALEDAFSVSRSTFTVGAVLQKATKQTTITSTISQEAEEDESTASEKDTTSPVNTPPKPANGKPSESRGGYLGKKSRDETVVTNLHSACPVVPELDPNSSSSSDRISRETAEITSELTHPQVEEGGSSTGLFLDSPTSERDVSLPPSQLPSPDISSKERSPRGIDASALYSRSKSMSPSPSVSEDDGGIAMVLDTTQASWSPCKRSTSSRDSATPVSKDSHSDDQPALKKRHLDPGVEEDLAGPPIPSSSSRPIKLPFKKTTGVQQNLKSYLASFTRPGPSATHSSVKGRSRKSSDNVTNGGEAEEEQQAEMDLEITPKEAVKVAPFPDSTSEIVDLTVDDDDGPTVLSGTTLSDELPASPASSRAESPERTEVIRNSSSGLGDLTIGFDLNNIEAKWTYRTTKRSGVQESGDGLHLDGVDKAGFLTEAGDEDASRALSRIISKEDFNGMVVVGQFNLGFILVRRRVNGENLKEAFDDMFIVDQHAADEKYNFETLQQTTVIQSQRLLRPEPIELTAADEILALEHLEILKKNGFEIQVDEAEDTPAGSRLKLVAHPVSKSTNFDLRDLDEIIHLCQDRPTGEIVRCSKSRAMFASRACRKSVMVGMPLTKKQMTAIMRHMGTMDQPWNCPHGRPTMRHLCDLSQMRTQESRKVKWEGLNF